MLKQIGFLTLVGCTAVGLAYADDDNLKPANGPNQGNKVHETLIDAANRGFSSTPAPITYHGGPVILGGTRVYIIWYGNWTGNTATTILPSFLSSIGGSPYFNINTTYYSKSGSASIPVSNTVTLAGQTTDNYSRGKQLNDSAVASVVSSALNSGRLPVDANGVYFVLTSQDVNETSGFCTRYCGWHTYGTYNGTPIKYAFVGNPARCTSACQAQPSVNGVISSPNGNVGADGMASIIAHELEEATTDPQLNAWYDSNGAENADKCAWTFGTMTKINNSVGYYYYNMSVGGKNYLIQQNWVNGTSQSCAMSH